MDLLPVRGACVRYRLLEGTEPRLPRPFANPGAAVHPLLCACRAEQSARTLLWQVQAGVSSVMLVQTMLLKPFLLPDVPWASDDADGVFDWPRSEYLVPWLLIVGAGTILGHTSMTAALQWLPPLVVSLYLTFIPGVHRSCARARHEHAHTHRYTSARAPWSSLDRLRCCSQFCRNASGGLCTKSLRRRT
jgi:hypothetical protein